jgi:uncharacterized RDD family membrane protein YckC/ribosomal protein L40E
MEEKPAGDTSGNTGKQPEVILSSSTVGGTESTRNKVCPRCGAINPPPSVYCYKCGLKLPDAAVQDKKICNGCYAVNSATSQYCYKCGLKLPDRLGTGYELTGKYAGFWVRLLAKFIDGIILNIVNYAVMMIAYFSIFGSTADFLKPFESYITQGGLLPASFWLFYGISVLASMIVSIAYYTIAIGKWGRTIGKKALGLKIVKPDGSRVSYWRAFGRYWADMLNGFTLGIGYLIIAFTEKKRGLHDYICDTIVIKTD